MPQALSLCRVFSALSKVRVTQPLLSPAVPGIVMTLGLMSPPCLGMASLPSRGAGVCPPMLANPGQVSEGVF